MENERVEQKTIKMEETRKQPSKSEVIGSVIGMGNERTTRRSHAITTNDKRTAVSNYKEPKESRSW